MVFPSFFYNMESFVMYHMPPLVSIMFGGFFSLFSVLYFCVHIPQFIKSTVYINNFQFANTNTLL